MLMVSRSDIGRVRQVNEDSALIGKLNDRIYFAIVADGMGGHQAGDVASQLAVEAFRKIVSQHEELEQLTIEDGKRIVKAAIRQANEDIYLLASKMEQYHNMGTTIVAALMWDEHVIIGHVGDSRAYFASDNAIERVTEDHSLVNVLIQSGQITEEEAEHHPRKNVLTRAIGTDDHVEVDVAAYTWGDRPYLMLCSDGLSNRVTNDQMLAVLSQEASIETKADQLIQYALEFGGEDNITLVLCMKDIHKREEESQ